MDLLQLSDLVNIESEDNDSYLDLVQQIFQERDFQRRFSSQGIDLECLKYITLDDINKFDYGA